MDINELISLSLGKIPIPNLKYLYYYLSFKTFTKVVRDGEFVIWASHIDQMEDLLEFQKGLSIIQEIKIDAAYYKTIQYGIKQRFPFQLSLSRHKDHYPMWKIYGGNLDGVMLTIDYHALRKAGYNIGECLYSNSPEYKMAVGHLLNPKNIKEVLDDSGHLLKVPCDSEFGEFLGAFPYIAKDAHYDYEEEVRIFKELLPRELNDDILNIESENGARKKYKQLHFSEDIVKCVTIAPCVESGEKCRIEEVSKLLAAHHLRKVSIDKSEILIRL